MSENDFGAGLIHANDTGHGGTLPRLNEVIAEMERLQRELDTDYARAIQGEVKSVAGNWRVVVNNALVVLKQVGSGNQDASAERAVTTRRSAAQNNSSSTSSLSSSERAAGRQETVEQARYRVSATDSNTAGVWYRVITDTRPSPGTSVEILVRGDSEKRARLHANRLVRLLNGIVIIRGKRVKR